MIELRKLEYKDAPFMLEWMHDISVVENLQADFPSMTIEDCKSFIDRSLSEYTNLHLAITDENDEYMGTVSLKNINEDNRSAELAIVVRKNAMGIGVSKDAMSKMLRMGFEKLYLHFIYWCVSPENKRAIRFYDKNGYKKIPVDLLGCIPGGGGYSTEQIQEFIWYQVENPK